MSAEKFFSALNTAKPARKYTKRNYQRCAQC